MSIRVMVVRFKYGLMRTTFENHFYFCLNFNWLYSFSVSIMPKTNHLQITLANTILLSFANDLNIRALVSEKNTTKIGIFSV